MNKTVLLLILGLTSSLFAQKAKFKISKSNRKALASTGYVRCATVEYEKMLAEENPAQISTAEFESWISSKIAKQESRSTTARFASETYVVPVVVHVIHDGDEVNGIGNVLGENISDAQVKSQIAVLNQDFRRSANTPGGLNSTGLAVDVGIEFALAKQDLQGLETTGIIRHNIMPYTDDVDNASLTDYGGGGADWESYEDLQKMKSDTQWDPTKYLNLWTVRMGGNSNEDGGLKDLLGFAQFPGNSGLGGLRKYEGSPYTDGVVIAYHAFGDHKKDDGSFVMNTAYNEGRTTTHEVGHWLGLRHIWGDSATCGNDDYCDDTPEATEGHTNCRDYDTCISDSLGKDMVENYMDYTADTCMDTFTQDQKERMIAVMKNSPRRVELLNSPALEEPLYSNRELESFVVNPNPITDFGKIVGFANGTVVLSVYDVSGKRVLSKRYYNVEEVFYEEIDLGVLVSGVYILLIENEGKKVIKRILKK